MATTKAYRNLDYLSSPGARTVRILCEYEEPQQRFRRQRVEDTVVIFGSARAIPTEVAQSRLEAAERALEAARPGNDEREVMAKEQALDTARKRLRLARYYDDTRLLARRLTEWSLETQGGRFVVCTGGGPGIMEAGNRGASDVDGGRSVGLGISLPMEEAVNQYVTSDLAFEFHYFFMRKYWFLYLAKALVICPGGFGTLDELAETLTLRQTKKVRKPLPTVLYGTDYWDDVLGLRKMVEWGTITERDLDLMHRSDSVDDAFAYLVGELG